MSSPEFLWTKGLVDALEAVDAARLDLFVNGDSHGNEIGLNDLDAYAELVRVADREMVKARQAARVREFYPYYPEGFAVETDTYDVVIEMLGLPMPLVPDDVEIDSVSH